MTRMRPAWARKPEAAIAMDFKKSMVQPFASTLAERGFEQPQAASVESGRGLVVHLVGGDFDHLVFEVHAAAAGAHLETGGPRALELARRGFRRREVPRFGAFEPDRRQHRPRSVKLQRGKVARPKVRRVGIGDVFGQQPLTLLMPLHPGAQHGKQRQVGDGHGDLVSSPADFAGCMVNQRLNSPKRAVCHQSAVYQTNRYSWDAGLWNCPRMLVLC